MFSGQITKKKNNVGNENLEAKSLMWVQCGKSLHWNIQIRAGDANCFEPMLDQILSHFNNFIQAYHALKK